VSEIIAQLAQFIETIILTLGYPGVAFVMFAENVFPPIPSELVMPFAGFVASSGQLNFFGVWIAGTIGSVLGAVVLYYFGMWAGDTVVRGFLKRYGRWIGVSEADYDRALNFFGKYGPWVVFFGRLIPLIRSLISVPAGANHMPMPQFLLYTTVGSAIWTGILAYAGLVLQQNWEQVMHVVEQYQDVVVILLIVLVVLFVGWQIWQRVSNRANNTNSTIPS
jgi:membrane protein DedA with SNARE-associated domain